MSRANERASRLQKVFGEEAGLAVVEIAIALRELQQMMTGHEIVR
jgi:hypothetical protein